MFSRVRMYIARTQWKDNFVKLIQNYNLVYWKCQYYSLRLITPFVAVLNSMQQGYQTKSLRGWRGLELAWPAAGTIYCIRHRTCKEEKYLRIRWSCRWLSTATKAPFMFCFVTYRLQWWRYKFSRKIK